MGRYALAAALVAAPLLVFAQTGGSLPSDVQSYLTKVGFTPAETTALSRGEVISRVDSGPIDTEIVAIAAVKIRSARGQTASYFGQVVSFVDGEVTLGFGKFSSPPAVGDVAALTLDREEIEMVRSCQPRDCDLRFGGAGIEAARTSIDWKAADANERVQTAFREAAVRYVTAYTERGDEALVTFDDRSKPVSLKDQWRGLVADSPYFHQYLPALGDYLQDYPRRQLPGARDIVYWIKENYGLKPVISIVHAVVYQPPAQPDRTIFAQKHIYASHYYDASAALTTLIETTEAGRPVTWMVYANRSRGDLLKGGFGGLKRKVARDQAKKAAETTLRMIQGQLEQAAGLR